MVSENDALNLLIVDDHRDIREMLVMAFEFRGHRVVAAESVAAAVAAAGKEQFDVVVSDWSLPDGTGADLMLHLRRQGLKGVVLSAYSAQQIGSEWRTAGFERVVAKYADLESIAGAVEEVGRKGKSDK
jgi:CheY-like chemotaxis protein